MTATEKTKYTRLESGTEHQEHPYIIRSTVRIERKWHAASPHNITTHLRHTRNETFT